VLHRYSWTLPVVAGLELAAGALEGAGIGLLIPLISTLTGSDQQPQSGLLGRLDAYASIFGESAKLFVVTGTILALIFLKCVLQMLNRTFIAWADGKISHDIRRTLATQLLSVGYPFFVREEPGRLLNIVANEVWNAAEAIRAAYNLIAAAAAVLTFAIFLLVISWQMSLAVAVGVLLIRSLRQGFTSRISRTSEQTIAANNALAARMISMLSIVRLVRIFGQEKRERARFERTSEQVRMSTLAVDLPVAMAGPTLEIAHAILFVAVLLGAYQSGMEVPVIGAFLVLLYRAQPHLRAIEYSRVRLASLAGAIREVDWLLDSSNRPAVHRELLSLSTTRRSIVFDNVCFSHEGPDDRAAALTNASFVIPDGTTTALIGPSGAGKSTIVGLLLRLIEPTSGRILVDGEDLSRLDLTAWRAKLAFAGQDLELLDGTVHENIAYGRPDASRWQVQKAAREADAESFINQLPSGYETEIGPRGTNLSEGQRQRIALARAFLREAPLLILDEATSALDEVSESAVIATLQRRTGHGTTIVVSHRASTLAACEHGIVVERGRIVETGRLSDLRWFRTAYQHAKRDVPDTEISEPCDTGG
jgi:ABC-type multidrug transport system fused ATPase/permease subunit